MAAEDDTLTVTPHAHPFARFLPLAHKIAPGETAKFLAKRYLNSSHAMLTDLAERPDMFSQTPVGDGLVLHFKPEDRPVDAKRVLIVPGHDGHFRQFLRMITALHKAGFAVDFVALPGHLTPEAYACDMGMMARIIRATVNKCGPYHGIVTHCVTANALIFELANGPLSDRIVLASLPLNVSKLVRHGGELMGLSDAPLDRFVDAVDALGAPYHLDTDWRAICKDRTERCLLLHSQDDFAAPVDDIYALRDVWPGTQTQILERGDHNGIVAMRSASDSIIAFMSAP